MIYYIYLALAIVCEVIATSALKTSAGFSRLIPSAVVVVGYGIAFFLLSLCLEKIPVGVAYAIWSAAGIVIIAFVGWLVHNQKLDVPGIVGMALIVGGVCVLMLLSKTTVP